ncbi:MAG TPA: hypothetical protein VH539_11685 [Gemmatimonadaceae bacterium]
MPRIHAHTAAIVAHGRSLVLASLAVVAATMLDASTLSAQAALGAPFIGSNNLSFYSSELTRSGNEETTSMYGLLYGHRFGSTGDSTRLTMMLRGSARAFDDVKAGILDVATTVGVSHDVSAVRGLSVAASTGLGMMAWGDDIAHTGRLRVTIPANAGASYDLHVRSATISPFAMGTVARYDWRTSVNDVRDSVRDGWDAYYTTGVSLRLKDVVVTSSRIIGEYGMPNRSRWAFAAGLSF